MVLTFLNLVFINGILVGLIEGSSAAYRAQYSGDVLITSLPTKDRIEQSQNIIKTLRAFPGVETITSRYTSGAVIEANYKRLPRINEISDRVSATLVGINPIHEQEVTKISDLVIEGRFFYPEDENKIVIGSGLLEEYSPVADIRGDAVLENVTVGSKVRILLDDVVQEVEVVGIIKSKVQAVDIRVFMTDTVLRRMLNRTDYNVGEIAVVLNDLTTPESVTSALARTGFDKDATLQTWRESQGTFFEDIRTTFDILGNVFGVIGLVVAAITVFIVVFVNAITRRRYIGILKGIGIRGAAIQLSYVVQSIFYALVGSFIGLLILYLWIKPYFDANPIDFPFSDGILVVPLDITLLRVGLLLIATIVAGYVPAKIIISKNTLDAILGR